MNNMNTWDSFKIAQDNVYTDVISELKAGKKQSHWMWLIFPQITGLGSSSISLRYALANLKSAKMCLDEQSLKSRFCVYLVVLYSVKQLQL